MAETTSLDVSTPACPVCLQHCHDMRLLPCLHSVCRDCVDQLFVSGENGSVRCPLCRTECQLAGNGAAGLPKDFTATTTDGHPSTVLCSVCTTNGSRNMATTVCKNCHVVLCDEHALPHLKMVSEGEHFLALFDKSEIELTVLQTTAPLCPKHGQPIHLHCGSCDTAICGDCGSLGDHQGHKPIQYVKDILEQRKTKVAKQVDEVKRERVERLESSLRAVDKVCAELEERAVEISADIQQAGKEAVAAVEEHVCRLLQEVDDMKEGRLKVLHEQRDDLKRQLEAAENALKFSKRLMKQTTGGSAFFSLLQALETHIAVLLCAEIADRPRHHSCFIFKPIGDTCRANKAKDSIGHLIPCQATAQKSIIEGQLSPSIRGSNVQFILQARNMNGEAVTIGGDKIFPRWVHSSSTISALPAITVDDHGNGKYTISSTPVAMGAHKLEVLINGERMPRLLSVVCHEMIHSWDAFASHANMKISNDRKKATLARSPGGYCSVLGSVPMSHGEFTWKIRIGSNVEYHMLGVATKPLSSNRMNDHRCAATGLERGSILYHGSTNYDNAPISWSASDTFQLCLNCDRHTLQMRNLHTGETGTFTNLPDKKYFQFASMYNKDNSVEFVD